MAGRIEDSIVIKDEASATLKKVGEELAATADATKAAQKAMDEKAESDRDAAKAAADLAAAEQAKAEALDRETAALAKLDPATREMVGAFKAAKSAADAEAKALGVTVGELAAIRRASTEAASAQDRAAASAEAAAAAEKQVADATEEAADSSEKMARAAGKAGQDSAKLRGILGLLSPELGAMAGFANDAFDALEVGASVGPMAAGALAAIALAAAPLAGHLMVLSREQAELTARSAFLTTHLHDLDSAARGMEDALLAAAVATGQLSEEEAKLQSIRDQATRSVVDFKTAQEGERKAAEDSYFASGKTLARLEMLPDFLSTAIDYYGGYTSAQQEAMGVLTQLDVIETEHQEVVVKTTEALEKGEKATQRKAGADREAARAVEEFSKMEEFRARVTAAATANLEAQMRMLDGMFAPAVDKSVGFLREFHNTLDGLVPPKALSDLERLTLLEADLAIEMSRQTINVDALALAQGRLAAAKKGAGNSPEQAAGAATTVLGGPQAVMGAVSAAGPMGALIAAIVSAVQNFGSIGDAFNDFTISFNESLGKLPETLGKNLGKWLETGTQSVIDLPVKFIQGLADALPDIIGGILNSIPKMLASLIKSIFVELPKAIGSLLTTLFTKDLWEGLWNGFKEAMIEAWESLFGKSSAKGQGALNQGGLLDNWFVGSKERQAGEKSTFMNRGGIFDAILGGVDENWWGLGGKGKQKGFATGGYVPRTGSYLLHQGERIVPPTGASTGTMESASGFGRSGGGASVTSQGGDFVIRIPADQWARAQRSQSGRGLQFGSG